MDTFPSESENGMKKLPVDVSQFHFRKAKWGFQGGEAPLASLGYVPEQGASGAKWHAVLRNLPIIPTTITAIFEGCGCGESSLCKSVAFPTFAPEKIFRNLQGDDSGFLIFRREWASGKQGSVSEDCFLLVHCRRKITQLRSS